MRVAFVGHGASLDGAGRGEEIDACDLVVRLHDCDWQVSEDHGLRYDYGILPGPWLYRAEVRRKPRRGWLIYCWERPRGKIPPEGRLVDVSAMRKELLRQGARCRIGTPAPTRGLAAVEMIASILRPDRISPFGCDGLMSGRDDGYLYHSALGRQDADTARRHDMAAERRVIDWIADRYQVEIG